MSTEGSDGDRDRRLIQSLAARWNFLLLDRPLRPENHRARAFT